MPTADDVLKLSNSAAAIALLCLIALGFFFFLIARWVGRLIENKILPVGEAGIDALKHFLTHLKDTQEKTIESQGHTSSGIQAIKISINEQTELLKQIADRLRNQESVAELLKEIAEYSKDAAINATKNGDTLEHNGVTLSRIAERLDSVCKIADVPCLAVKPEKQP